MNRIRTPSGGFDLVAPHLHVAVAEGVSHIFTRDRNDAFAEQRLRYLAERLAL